MVLMSLTVPSKVLTVFTVQYVKKTVFVYTENKVVFIMNGSVIQQLYTAR